MPNFSRGCATWRANEICHAISEERVRNLCSSDDLKWHLASIQISATAMLTCEHRTHPRFATCGIMRRARLLLLAMPPLFAFLARQRTNLRHSPLGGFTLRLIRLEGWPTGLARPSRRS
jgi:hypothetical protein